VRRAPHPEALLAVLSLVLTLGALEGVARLRLGATAREALPHVGLDDQDENRLRWLARRQAGDTNDGMGFDRPDALLGWAPTPDLARRNRRPGSYDVVVHTTVDGLRGRDPVARARLPGRARVAVFGCSQTFGAEVEDDETYSAQLGHRLHDVDVLNFGVHGYGTDQMLLRYRRDGAPYRPDVVVVGFAYYHLLRNQDAFRFFAKPRFVLDDGTLRLVGVPVPTPGAYAAMATMPSTHALLDHSVLLRWAWSRLETARQSRLYSSDSPAWALGRAILRRFVREVTADGGRVVIVNVEDVSEQLEPVLADMARADGATFVNAGATLGDLRHVGRRLRVPDDPHWGPEGHARIADDLATTLCAEHLVPTDACGDGDPP